MKWKLNPMRTNPSKGWLIAAIGLGAFAVGTLAFGGLTMGVVGALIVFGSCAEYWLGSRYSINEKGATRQVGFSITEMPWEKVKRIEVQKAGILISPLAKDSTMGPFRGVFLQFGDRSEGEILDAIRSMGGDYVQGMV